MISYVDILIQHFAILAVLAIIAVLFLKKQISNKFKIGVLLGAIALYVSYPLYNDYLVWQHDMFFHLFRIENITTALTNGQFPVRIQPLWGWEYGYPTSMMYPELFIYIPALLRIIGASTIFSYKILLIFINFVAVFGMYSCVKNISKSTTAGFVGAILFAAANYRLESLFTRAAIGESLALAFLPIAIWGLYELCVGNKKKWYVFVIGTCFVVQSHIISILFLIIICIIIGIVFIKNLIKEKRYLYILLSGLAIFCMNLWFIVPFIDTYNLGLNVSSDTYYASRIFPR